MLNSAAVIEHEDAKSVVLSSAELDESLARYLANHGAQSLKQLDW